MPLNESQIFWRNIEKVKDNQLLDDAQFAKEIQMDLKEYLKIQGSTSLLPLDVAFVFAEKFNFHFEDLFKKDFKLKAGNSTTALLDRYTMANYSQTKPIMSIMHYLEQVRGPRAKVNVLRKFQLSEEFLQNDKHKTNIFMISDIATYIRSTFKFSDEEFIRMGQTTPFASENSFLREKLTGHTSVQKMLTYFFEECTHLFDRNFHYTIEVMNKDYAIIAAIPKKAVMEELQVDLTTFGSVPSSLSRAGVISSMTMFQYNQNAPVSKISCMYNADKYDRYLLDLTVFRKSRANLTLVH